MISFVLNFRDKHIEGFVVDHLKRLRFDYKVVEQDIDLSAFNDSCILTDSFNANYRYDNLLINNRLFVVFFCSIDNFSIHKEHLANCSLFNKRVFLLPLFAFDKDDCLCLELLNDIFKNFFIALWNLMGVTFSFESYVLESIKDKELAKLSIIDGLTGVYNRGFFETFIVEEYEKYQRVENNVFCIGVIDIDNFKSVNDTYGHVVGDQVLKSVTATITSKIRKYDKVFRYGGEEFIIFFPLISVQDGYHVMERVRKGVENTVITVKKDDGKYDNFYVTISGGIDSIENHDSIKSLIESADQLLYQAKRTGKNKICYNKD